MSKRLEEQRLRGRSGEVLDLTEAINDQWSEPAPFVDPTDLARLRAKQLEQEGSTDSEGQEAPLHSDNEPTSGTSVCCGDLICRCCEINELMGSYCNADEWTSTSRTVLEPLMSPADSVALWFEYEEAMR